VKNSKKTLRLYTTFCCVNMVHLCQCWCRLVPYRAGTKVARCRKNEGKKKIPKLVEFSTPSLTRSGTTYSPYFKWKFFLI